MCVKIVSHSTEPNISGLEMGHFFVTPHCVPKARPASKVDSLYILSSSPSLGKQHWRTFYPLQLECTIANEEYVLVSEALV